MEWYLKVLRNYGNFSGRARRMEYWMFYLVNLIVGLIIGIIINLFGDIGYYISGFYSIFILLPVIAVTIRRLHDTGKSAWYLLLTFVPIIGQFLLIYFTLLEGTPGGNQYGPNPKELHD